jgi:hypothetical protein
MSLPRIIGCVMEHHRSLAISSRVLPIGQLVLHAACGREVADQLGKDPYDFVRMDPHGYGRVQTQQIAVVVREHRGDV